MMVVEKFIFVQLLQKPDDEMTLTEPSLIN